MSKSDEIKRLTDWKRSSSEIAAIVGCSSAYVRAVWQRWDGQSKADKAYSKTKIRRDKRAYAMAWGEGFRGKPYEMRRKGRALLRERESLNAED